MYISYETLIADQGLIPPPFFIAVYIPIEHLSTLAAALHSLVVTSYHSFNTRLAHQPTPTLFGMIILNSEREDFIPTPAGVMSSTASGSMSSSAPIDANDTSLSALSTFILKIYAFGGLGLMVCVGLSAIGLWVWTVVIKREFADSPPELELHPERMREKEKARIARLKKQKEERKAKRRARDEIFTLPPIRQEQKKTRSSSLSPNYSAITTASSHPPIVRKSSFSTSPSKGKRVSWASSTSTVDGNGNASEKPLEDKTSPAGPIKSPFQSEYSLLQSVPKARTSTPRSSVSIEERSRRGQEMVAATTPEVALGWAAPNENTPCSDNVDPLDTSRPWIVSQDHSYRD
ncbi:unnamed protein product [Cyclocybe aegerita]|uniref:Uncharacterized protein n=1 Tax=Cyclocybe aegerita TaxID=1973307 RepID=A0A8S0W2E1_CYCAE|nr:unnamed protein product [Cyclocybe aegerita]